MATINHDQTGGLPETYQQLEIESRQYTFDQFPTDTDGVQEETGQTVYFTFADEPMYDDGGLDHNEVAEVVGFNIRVIGQFEHGATSDLGDFPLRPASVQFRGSFGINLAEQDIINGFDEDSRNEPGTARSVEGGTGGTASVYSDDDQGRLHQLGLDAESPYFDTSGTDADGPYAGGGVVSKGTEVDFSYPVDMGIRGPVIDENDDLSVIGAIVSEQTIRLPFELTVQVDVFYNVMEIEGVRQDFGMPPGA